jgi:catechol 2,3-dioxygenase-like lactoylglutathione lyase family enzyme
LLGQTPFVGFVPTEDLEASRRFYMETLGLPLTEASEFANVFDAGGTQLRVTLVPARAEAGYTLAGWAVENIAATVATLRDAGIQFKRFPGMEQDDDAVWTSPGGARIAWFADPDGNTLSLQQAAAGD